MIPNIGPLEIAIVLIITLVVFGPKRLPDLGKSLGKGLREFREGVNTVGGDDKDDEDKDDLHAAALTQAPAADPEVAEVPVETVKSGVVSA